MIVEINKTTLIKEEDIQSKKNDTFKSKIQEEKRLNEKYIEKLLNEMNNVVTTLNIVKRENTKNQIKWRWKTFKDYFIFKI